MKTKEMKQKEAMARQALRNERSNKEQIIVLDERLGENVGAFKERKRLNQ